MTISEILEKVSNDSSCRIHMQSSQNLVFTDELQRLSEVIEFYTQCNGIELFEDKEYSYRILPIEKVLPMDRQYYGECWCDDKIISDTWYLIAEDWNGNKIAIDTAEERLGRMYDCYIGENYPVVAKSLSDFLDNTYKNRGGYTYWLKEDYKKIDPCDY